MFFKNKNIIFKIRRSKVTDYAALKEVCLSNCVISPGIEIQYMINKHKQWVSF